MNHRDENHADVLPVEAEDGVELLPSAAEPVPAGRAPIPHSRFRGGFFLKISIHLTLLVLISGIVLTVAMAFRFREELYREEFRAAFTVYTAAANYVAAHYRSHKGKFVREHLDYVFRERFMRPEAQAHELSEIIEHQLSRLVLYDLEGRVQYEFTLEGLTEPPADVPASSLPATIQRRQDRRLQMIHLIGPVAPENEIAAYLDITFPSGIRPKLLRLYAEMGALMTVILLVVVGVSLLFARRELMPILSLTRAAHSVHHGDLGQKVPVRGDDEIGELTVTFNDMVGSLSQQITLMHRLQEGIVRIGREVTGDRLYPTLLGIFSGISATRATRLYLFDPQKKSLQIRCEQEGALLPAPEEDDLAQSAFDERWAQFATAGGGRSGNGGEASEVAIPLLSGTHRIGVIRLGPPAGGGTYLAETVATLHTLAQFASVAIENADLYRELEAKQRIEQEMLWARSIQQSMLPRSTPDLAGYDIYGRSVPANEVGGDYFDFVATPDRHWHVVIGDVSGKGVPAALIMSIVRSLIHTFLKFEQTPREVLRLVNQSLSQDLNEDMFVTLSTMRLDPARNRVQIARAGHEPVMVLRSHGELEEIAPRGAALGLVDVDDFQRTIEQQEFGLEPDDLLLLYTDGVTEAQNPAREEFGHERLREIVRRHRGATSRQLFDSIMTELQRYADGAPQYDDITLVVVRRT